MQLYVDGELAGEGKAPGLIAQDPVQGLQVGTDALTSVGNYTTTQFVGIIDELRLYFHGATADQISRRLQRGL